MFDIYDLFESVGIIVDAKLKELPLDRTILGTIVDTSECDKGSYKVSYGDVVFSANSADRSLSKNDLVYVGVPQGDYVNAYIISKKITKFTEQYSAIPFENYIQELQYYPEDYTFSSSTDSEKMEFTQPFVNVNKFKKLGISAKVITNCSIDDIPMGTLERFGLRLFIKSKNIINNKAQYYLNTIDCDLASLLGGDPFRSNGYRTIQALYDISNITHIEQISIAYYIDDSIKNKINLNNIIQIQDLILSFGDLREDYIQEGFTIYADKNTTYNNTSSDIDTYTLYGRFVYKENDQLQIITPYTNIPDNISISWQKNNSTLVNENKWTCTVSSNHLNQYKAKEIYSAIIRHNSIVLDTPIEYKDDIVFINSSEDRKIFYSELEDMKLMAKTMSFKDIYNPDGTIVDASLVKDQENYKIYFKNNKSPFKKANYSSDIKFQLRLLIPSFKTNIYVNDIDINYFNNEVLADDQEVLAKSNILFYKIAEKATPEGYVLYTKNINETLSIDLPAFQIKEYYQPSAVHNEIICELIAYAPGDEDEYEIVEQEKYKAAIEFTRSGICKTDYSLVPTITDDKGNIVHSIKAKYGSRLNVTAKLYNAAGDEIALGHPISWSWYKRRYPAIDGEERDAIEQYDKIIINSIGQNGCSLISNFGSSSNPYSDYDETHDYTYILCGKYDMYRDNLIKTQVQCLIPIAVNYSLILDTDKDNNTYEVGYLIEYLQGPTNIYYNSAGGEPSYYHIPYVLYSSQDTVYSDIEWDRIIPNDNLGTFYPRVERDNELDYFLHVPTMFIKGAETGTVFIAKHKIDGADSIFWTQPIVSQQIKSFSSVINDWNGSNIQIKEEEGYILTPAFGTGRIDANEEGFPLFSGVLLGDVNEKIVEDGSTILAGIYGYGQNEQSYAFKEDGTAFIGKSGEGRIEFDGTQGVIQSANFDGTEENPQGTQGSYWNLKDGKLITNEGYFRGDIVANSLTLSDTGTTDLLDGVVTEQDLGDYVKFGTTSNGNAQSYTLSKDGLMQAKNAYIEGTVVAEKGLIGGWNIGQERLFSSNEGSVFFTGHVMGMAPGMPWSVPRSITMPDKKLIPNEVISDLQYEVINDNKTKQPIGYRITAIGESVKKETKIRIPAYYNGLPVTTINDEVFSCPENKETNQPLNGPYEVTELYIPSTINYIGKKAFRLCTKLQYVDFFKTEGVDYTLTSLSKDAFERCYALETIFLPPSLTYIGEEAFHEDIKLINIILPDNLTTISDRAFANCESLMRLDFPNTLTRIEEGAFYKCHNLVVTTPIKAAEWPSRWHPYWTAGIKTILFEYSGNGTTTPSVPIALGDIIERGYPAFYAGAKTSVPLWSEGAKFMVLDNGIMKAEGGRLGSIAFYDTIIDNENTSVFHTDSTSLAIRTQSGAQINFNNKSVQLPTATSVTLTYTIETIDNGGAKLQELNGQKWLIGQKYRLTLNCTLNDVAYVNTTVSINYKLINTVNLLQNLTQVAQEQLTINGPSVINFRPGEKNKQISEIIYGTKMLSSQLHMNGAISAGEAWDTSPSVGWFQASQGENRQRTRIELLGDLIPNKEGKYWLGQVDQPFERGFITHLYSDYIYSKNLQSEEIYSEKVESEQIYSANEVIVNSDENVKKNICLLEQDHEYYDLIYDDLKPISYELVYGKSNRRHLGLSANDIKNTLDKYEINTQNFAAYCEWDQPNKYGATCGIRYEELIPLNIYEIQKLKKRIAELETIINVIQQEGNKNG